jgi:HPt (histidine-containing phosphotransfer) domain-containing protein
MNDFLSKPINAIELNNILLKWLPPEKILTDALDTPEDGGESSSRSRVLESRADEILSRLAQIDDLSITKGLSGVGGDKEVYISIMRQFCKTLDKDIAAILSFESEENWKDYGIRLHAMKSVFANLGNPTLSDWALRLEMAATNQDIPKCLEETNAFCDSMKKFQEKLLKTSLMDEPDNKTAKKKIELGALSKMMEELVEACCDCDTASADDIAARLKQCTFREDVDACIAELCDLVESFDYDEVIGRQEEIVRLLSF